MAKNVRLNSSDWCDMIFEGKNKFYGAYHLRKTSSKRHLVAFLVTLVMVAVLMLLFIFISSRTATATNSNLPYESYINGNNNLDETEDIVSIKKSCSRNRCLPVYE